MVYTEPSQPLQTKAGAPSASLSAAELLPVAEPAADGAVAVSSPTRLLAAAATKLPALAALQVFKAKPSATATNSRLEALRAAIAAAAPPEDNVGAAEKAAAIRAAAARALAARAIAEVRAAEAASAAAAAREAAAAAEEAEAEAAEAEMAAAQLLHAQ